MSNFEDAIKATKILNESFSEDDQVVTDQVPEEDLTGNEDEAITVYSDDTDEESYIGKLVVKCPICGEYYFCDCEDIDTCKTVGICQSHCPICDEDVDATVIGIVSKLDSDEPKAEDEPATEEPEANDDEATPTEDDEDIISVDDKVELSFSESNMNKLFDKFVEENYEDVDHITLKSVSSNYGKKLLKLECILKYKNSNKVEKIVFESNNFKLGKHIVFEATCKKFSNKKAFVIESVLRGGMITPTKLSYKYNTNVMVENSKGIKESKRAEVKGSHTITESKYRRPIK